MEIIKKTFETCIACKSKIYSGQGRISFKEGAYCMPCVLANAKLLGIPVPEQWKIENK
jgi:hypothetical protein